MIKKRGKLNIDKLAGNFAKFKKSAPVEIASLAEAHFVHGFRRGGGQTDAGRWEKRKRERKQETHTKRGKRRKATLKRSILVLTGDLRESIKVRRADFKKIIIGSYDTRYAAIHNFGLIGLAWGKNRFKMPKREFLGKSSKLDDKMKRVINRRLRELKR